MSSMGMIMGIKKPKFFLGESIQPTIPKTKTPARKPMAAAKKILDCFNFFFSSNKSSLLICA